MYQIYILNLLEFATGVLLAIGIGVNYMEVMTQTMWPGYLITVTANQCYLITSYHFIFFPIIKVLYWLARKINCSPKIKTSFKNMCDAIDSKKPHDKFSTKVIRSIEKKCEPVYEIDD